MSRTFFRKYNIRVKYIDTDDDKILYKIIECIFSYRVAVADIKNYN